MPRPISDNFVKVPVPEVGKTYHFWDDGKSGHSRHHMATVLEVIPFDQMKNKKLLSAWKEQSNECYWCYAPTTDYFIKCSIPTYDDDPVYFVRRNWGGWFSIDFPHWWMGGELDVDESHIKAVLKSDPDYLKDEEKYPKAKEEVKKSLDELFGPDNDPKSNKEEEGKTK